MFDFGAGTREIIDKLPTRAKIDKQFIEMEIQSFKKSLSRRHMLDGERYFQGHHDILRRKRTAIGENGDLTEVKNLPNNRIVDNQYRKMVIQKNNYLLGKPFTIKCDNEQYSNILNLMLDQRFKRSLKNIGEDSLNCGLGWLFITYDDFGVLSFKRFRPYEIIAGWKDAEHTILDYAIRTYHIVEYEGTKENVITKVEVYDNNGITFFELSDSGVLHPAEPYHQNYFVMRNHDSANEYNWSKIPLIPFKYNNKEVPLIKFVKSLQDGINLITSNFQNNMEEDARNTILVIMNYDNQSLGEFRKNIATYGAVKIRTGEGVEGDVKTLQIEVNAENYKTILDVFKKAIIENAMGYDAKDERMSGTPNQMNIMSMYSDIDLDANGMETEYQASFEEMLWFIDAHLYNTGQGDFEGEKVEIIFNRDILMNEGEIIDNVIKSDGLLSKQTTLAKHPWVTDVDEEIKRAEEQKQAEIDLYGNQFGQNNAAIDSGGALDG